MILIEPSDNVLVWVIVILGGLVASLVGAIVFMWKRRSANGSKPNIRLEVADALRVEIDKNKLATVILISEQHTLEIKALRRDVDELKDK